MLPAFFFRLRPLVRDLQTAQGTSLRRGPHRSVASGLPVSHWRVPVFLYDECNCKLRTSGPVVVVKRVGLLQMLQSVINAVFSEIDLCQFDPRSGYLRIKLNRFSSAVLASAHAAVPDAAPGKLVLTLLQRK
jgi:hypothetical protein